jgi:hypothetical protein
MKIQSLAVPLGLFSIGLGLLELFAPRRLAAAHGSPEAEPVIKVFGAREIAAGVGILAAPTHPAGLWARAGGDVLDIAAAGAAVARAEGKARKLAMGTLAFVVGALVVDVLVARALSAAPEPG